MMATYLSIAVEDPLSENTLRALIAQAAPKIEIARVLCEGGNGYIKKIVNGLNGAAKGHSYFVLTDLDKHPCPLAIIKTWLKGPIHQNLLFRVAVPEVDAWLFAHRDEFASFLGVTHLKRDIPQNADSIPDPKRLLIDLCRHSKSKRIREAFVPEDGSTAKIGPGYNEELATFVMKRWKAKAAARNSPSLQRTIKRLATFRFNPNAI